MIIHVVGSNLAFGNDNLQVKENITAEVVFDMNEIATNPHVDGAYQLTYLVTLDHLGKRYYSFSNDGGLTWSNPVCLNIVEAS